MTRDAIHKSTYESLRLNELVKQRIHGILQSEGIKTKLIDFEEYISNETVNNIDSDKFTNIFKNILLDVCKHAGASLKSQKTKPQKQDALWFDLECKLEKENLRALGSYITKHTQNNQSLRQHLYQKKKQFKSLCRTKKSRCYTSIDKLNFNNPKQLWKEIRALFNVRKNLSGQNCPVEIDKVFTHFKNLNKSENTGNIEDYYSTDSEETGVLDFEIAPDEIIKAIGKLKLNKSPGIDNIPNEVLKLGKTELCKSLTLLFNKILVSGNFPQSWRIGLIVPIHKKAIRRI